MKNFIRITCIFLFLTIFSCSINKKDTFYYDWVDFAGNEYTTVFRLQLYIKRVK